jgi:hypothetical protein
MPIASEAKQSAVGNCVNTGLPRRYAPRNDEIELGHWIAASPAAPRNDVIDSALLAMTNKMMLK